jgi:hypothetical protein
MKDKKSKKVITRIKLISHLDLKRETETTVTLNQKTWTRTNKFRVVVPKI